MNIYLTQKSIVERLQLDFTEAGTSFLALDLPDSEDEFESGFVNSIAYVVYTGSQALGSVSTSVIAQPRKARFNLECHARTLYGPTGLYAMRDVVEQSIIGFMPTNSNRLYLLKDDIKQTDEGLWVHVYELECDLMLIQKDESDLIVVPSFQELITEE